MKRKYIDYESFETAKNTIMRCYEEQAEKAKTSEESAFCACSKTGAEMMCKAIEKACTIVEIE